MFCGKGEHIKREATYPADLLTLSSVLGLWFSPFAAIVPTACGPKWKPFGWIAYSTAIARYSEAVLLFSVVL